MATAADGSECLAMEYGGEQSLNDLIEKRKEQGLKAFPAANIEKVALHVARGLQVRPRLLSVCVLLQNFTPLVFAVPSQREEAAARRHEVLQRGHQRRL